MATIDKLEYINNTKNLIKNALNTKFNSQIGDGDTFRSYAQKIDDIYENWPKVSEEDTNFTLNSTKEGKMKIDLKGNTNQDTNIITYTCLGTETGDYYFVYNSINYQFTMPTISANDVLAFNTDTLKLYLDTTEITTTTASTGTLITMNTTPNPNYPQDIHIVSGDNTIEVQGKNLLHLPNGTITNRGITGTISNDNILTYSGTASSSYADIISATRGVTLQAGTYMFSIDQPQLCRIVLYVSGEASFNTIITIGKTSASFTLNEPKIINYRIGITGMTSKNSYSGTIKMQLEKNNKATTYEPYQNQNYPINLENIELCKIGDYQDSIKKSTGKNLFENVVYKNNYIIASNGTETGNALGCIWKKIKVKPNTTYTLSYTSTDYSFAQRVSEYNSSDTFIQRSTTQISPYTFTTTSTTEYINLSGLKIDTNIMINEGTTALDYEPYGTGWYKYNAIQKKIFTGTENWTYRMSSGVKRYDLSQTGSAAGSAQSNPVLCNYFLSKYANEDNVVYLSSTIGTMSIMSNNFSDLATFKNWLSNGNVMVYYALQTPTYTEITDSTLLNQLEALKKAISYDEQTNINQNNNDLPFILNVSALKKNSSN